MARRGVRAVVGFTIALVVVGLFLALVGWDRVVAELAGADPVWLGVAALAVVGAFLLWIESFRWMVRGVGHRVGDGYRRAYMAGEFAKQVIPMGQAGAPVFLAYAVSAETDTPYDDVLAAATVFTLVNIAASLVVATGGLVVLFLTGDGPLEPAFVALSGGLVFAVAVLGVAVGLVSYSRALLRRLVLALTDALGRTVGRVSARVRAGLARERVDARFGAYYAAFDRMLADRRRLGAAVALSIGAWILFLVPLFAGFLAVGEPVSYALVVFVVPVVTAVNVVPLPGGLGGYEVAVAAAMAALAPVDLPTATAAVFLARLANYWFVVLLGGLASASLSAGLGDAPPVLPVDVPDMDAESVDDRSVER